MPPPSVAPRLFVGVVLTHLAAFLVLDDRFRGLVTTSAGLVATVVVAYALFRRRVQEPGAWAAALAGLAVLVVHNISGDVAVHLLGADPGAARSSALLLPLGYLGVLTGALLLLRRAALGDTGAVLDSAVAGLTLSLLLWFLVVDPSIDPSVSTSARTQSAVTVVVLGATGGAVSQVAALWPARRTVAGYLLLALLGALAGTLARDLTATSATPRGTPLVVVFWIVAYAALAACVLHPSMRRAEAPPRRTPRLTPTRLALLAVGLAAGPTVFLVGAHADLRTPPVFVAAVAFVTVVLTVARLAALARLHGEARERAAHLADHDSLTGLPNRRALHRRLDDLLERVTEGTAPGAVLLFVDLDDFKGVNDRLGHAVGDDLLQAVAERLRATVRTGGTGSRRLDDVVARLAGDEFVVLLEAAPSAAPHAARRIQAAIDGDVTVPGHVLTVRGSVGSAAVGRGHRATGDALLSTADQRMYAAKRRTRDASARPAVSAGTSAGSATALAPAARTGAAPARRRGPGAHVLVASGLLVWGVAYLVTDGFARDVVVGGVVLAPALAVAAVLATRRLPQPRPWWFVLAGVVVLAGHNAAWLVEAYGLGGGPHPVPGAVLLLPSGYLLLLVGAVVLLRQSVRQESGAVLDSAIIALSLSLLLWVLVIAPALDDHVPTASRIRTMVILVVVAAIGGALARAAALVPERRGSIGYMLVAILATLAGTLARDMTSDAAAPAGARWVGLLWIVAYLMLVGGATHPSAANVVRERGATDRLTNRRVWALGGALAAGPGTLLLDAALGTTASTVFIASVNLALVPLVVLRVGHLARLHAEAEQRLEHLADHDVLTGLPNRRALERHLEELLDRVAAGTAPGVVVLFTDLDDFKVVNDTLGHRAGDELLVAVADRLRQAVRPGDSSGRDLVARFAGDEFVVVLETDPALAVQAARHVHEALADDVVLAPHVLRVRASIGVATVAAGSHATAEEVLSSADARMYERKRERRAGDPDASPVVVGGGAP